MVHLHEIRTGLSVNLTHLQWGTGIQPRISLVNTMVLLKDNYNQDMHRVLLQDLKAEYMTVVLPIRRIPMVHQLEIMPHSQYMPCNPRTIMLLVQI